MLSNDVNVVGGRIVTKDASPQETYAQLKNMSKIVLQGYARRINYPELSDFKRMDEESIRSELISYLHGSAGTKFLENPNNFRDSVKDSLTYNIMNQRTGHFYKKGLTKEEAEAEIARMHKTSEHMFTQLLATQNHEVKDDRGTLYGSYGKYDFYIDATSGKAYAWNREKKTIAKSVTLSGNNSQTIENLKKDLVKDIKINNAPDSQFDQAQLTAGINEEMKEHGATEEEAKSIAKDHLIKDPKYYSKGTKDAAVIYKGYKIKEEGLEFKIYKNDRCIIQKGFLNENTARKYIDNFLIGYAGDSTSLLTCKSCKSTFTPDAVKRHIKHFGDKKYMTTKHCPNCDKRISLKDENPDIEEAKKRIVLLNRYGAQCRMCGEGEEYRETMKEIKQLEELIKNIRSKDVNKYVT